MTDTRDSFEKYICARIGLNIPNFTEKYSDGTYVHHEINSHWGTWQAALQSGAGDGDSL